MSSIFIIIFIKLKNSCTSNLAAILIDLVLKRQPSIFRVAAYIIQETKINLCYMFLYFLKNTNMDTIKTCKPIL